jgi:GNAT superfamily N-acetyltransferase
MMPAVADLIIRPITTADFAAWLPLWQGYQTFYHTQISEETTRTTWSRFLDPAEPMHAAVAELDGELLGFVHFIEHRSCWTTGNYMYLQDLFTSENARRRGVGRALIEHVYAEAAARGCARVYWLTHETNTEARALYEQVAARSGFIQYRKML